MRQQGFSLLEVLVAFTILALSLGILMQIFSSSLRNADITRDQAQAAALAQSLLAGSGVETPLASGETSGTIDQRFRWQLQVSPFEDQANTDSPVALTTLPSLDLWQVLVRVSWGADATPGERVVTLSTLRVQVPPQPP